VPTCLAIALRRQELQDAGWGDDPHSIAEQGFFTDGRIDQTVGKFGGADRLRTAVNQTQIAAVSQHAIGLFAELGWEAVSAMEEDDA